MKENLENDILQYGLMIGISYQFYQTVMSFVPTFHTNMALINMLITMTILFLYILTQKKGAHPIILLVLHALALAAFTFFWKNFGGLSGTVPSFYCAYVAFIVVCSHGITRWVIIFSMALILIFYFVFPELLGMNSFFEPSNISSLQKNIDYLVVAILIIVFTIYMNTKFTHYRDGVSTKYLQLDQIANTLHEQNRELATRQEETRAINDNLEAMVYERTKQIEVKNRELSEYAFINAHVLRGPLCRMLGLINLMEKEPEQYPLNHLNQIKKIAQEIDQQIKEINSVVS
jgi:signal transduction histidine kinase